MLNTQVDTVRARFQGHIQRVKYIKYERRAEPI